MAKESNQDQPRIPEHEIQENSGVSATMALQAAQKAWDLRQAANAAGDPNAREEILAKAINKEIEAESFGKAAKYTQSGAFQGLAAGAGLGVQPGVTIGKITGALVGGVISTVTGLLGGGIGSVYGAMNGPFWNLGEMASHGVRGVVGDFPNWKSTPAQKRALEKMVMQTRETQAPSKEELEQMSKHAPDEMPQAWSQSTKDITSWRPSVPSMPTGAALRLGGLGASLPSWGGRNQKDRDQATQQVSARDQDQQTSSSEHLPKLPQEASTPKKATAPKETSDPGKKYNAPEAEPKGSAKSVTTAKPSPKARLTSVSSEKSSTAPTSNSVTPMEKAVSDQATQKHSQASDRSLPTSKTKASIAPEPKKKRPRKIQARTSSAPSRDAVPTKRAPRKLTSRAPAA